MHALKKKGAAWRSSALRLVAQGRSLECARDFHDHPAVADVFAALHVRVVPAHVGGEPFEGVGDADAVVGVVERRALDVGPTDRSEVAGFV